MKTFKLTKRLGLIFAFVGIALCQSLMTRNKVCFDKDMPKHFSPIVAIVAFEFAESADDVHEIVTAADKDCPSTEEQRVDFLRDSIFWDYFFLILYATFFSLMVVLLVPDLIFPIRHVLIAAVCLAAVLDIGENIYMTKILEATEARRVMAHKHLSAMFGFAFSKWMILFIWTFIMTWLSIRTGSRTWRYTVLLIYGLALMAFVFSPFFPLPGIGNIVQLMLVLSLLAWSWLFFRALGFFSAVS